MRSCATRRPHLRLQPLRRACSCWRVLWPSGGRHAGRHWRNAAAIFLRHSTSRLLIGTPIWTRPRFVPPTSGLHGPAARPSAGGSDPLGKAFERPSGLAATAGQDNAAPWSPPGLAAPRADERPPEAPPAGSWREPAGAAVGGEIGPSAWADPRAASDPVLAAEYMDRPGPAAGHPASQTHRRRRTTANSTRTGLPGDPATDGGGSRAVDQFMYISSV